MNYVRKKIFLIRIQHIFILIVLSDTGGQILAKCQNQLEIVRKRHDCVLIIIYLLRLSFPLSLNSRYTQ